MHMTAIDLAPPAIANLDLAVTRGCAITNDEVISEPVLHVAHVLVIIIKDAGVPLARAAVVDNDHLPAGIAPIGSSAIDRSPN